jgi:ketosteroid isomerase-like protein
MDAASQFFHDLTADGVEAALARTTADFTWTVAGKPGQGFALAGIYDREHIPAMLGRVAAALPEGPQVDITPVTETRERIVVETHVTGRAAAGIDYDNRLVCIFDLRGERICALREYLDTIHASEVFTR